jgi:hypothetical protein
MRRLNRKIVSFFVCAGFYAFAARARSQTGLDEILNGRIAMKQAKVRTDISSESGVGNEHGYSIEAFALISSTGLYSETRRQTEAARHSAVVG